MPTLLTTGTHGEKGGFVEDVETGAFVYEIREGSMPNGPYSKKRSMMHKSFTYWVIKNLVEFIFFGMDAHRGFDGAKHLPGQLTTAYQKKEDSLGNSYEKDQF